MDFNGLSVLQLNFHELQPNSNGLQQTSMDFNRAAINFNGILSTSTKFNTLQQQKTSKYFNEIQWTSAELRLNFNELQYTLMNLNGI